MSFKKTEIISGDFDAYKLIGEDWLLVTAGSTDSYNTMTASWGQTGVLWNKKVMTVYIRPNRKTYEFIEDNEYFTVSCFDGECREILNFCGTHSGRDCDKAKETGLVPADIEGNAAFEQASKVFLCKKLYIQDMTDDCFIDKSLLKFYGDAETPHHRMYVGEIIGVYEKE